MGGESIQTWTAPNTSLIRHDIVVEKVNELLFIHYLLGVLKITRVGSSDILFHVSFSRKKCSWNPPICMYVGKSSYFSCVVKTHYIKLTVMKTSPFTFPVWGGGPRVVVSTAAFHARVRGSVPGLGGLKETKLFLPHPRVKVSIVGSLRDREVACSASDRQGSNFESCVWRTVSSQSSHHPQEVLLAQFSLYVHKGGLKPDSFHLYSPSALY